MIRYASRNFYAEEAKVYKQAHEIVLRDEEIKPILKKLFNHFKTGTIKCPVLKIRGNHGGSYSAFGVIRVRHNSSMALLIHEFAHFVKDRGLLKEVLTKIEDRGTDHHGYHFEVCLAKCHEFAQSKGYWLEYLKNRRNKDLAKMAKKLENAGVLGSGEQKIVLRKEPENFLDLGNNI